ncbi:MAG: nucleoside kinase [Deltaproteobacteria bacterium]|nr:nucleoside kinase [Deltaproteobacteria bacterium]
MKPTLVRIRLGGQELDVPYGVTAAELFAQYVPPSEQPPLAAIVHQRCVDLSFRVTAPTEVIPVDYTRRQGVLAYRRTASLLLLEAMRRLFGEVRVTIGQALGNGYSYHPRLAGGVTPQQVEEIERVMRELVSEDLPLVTERVSVAEARDLFTAAGSESKLRLLRTHWESHIELVRLGETWDIHHYPVAPRTGFIRTFALVHEPPGFVLRFPPRGKPQPVSPYVDLPKLMQVYQETRRWLGIVGLESVGQLNELTQRGEAAEVIRIDEGLHEKKIAQVADEICRSTGIRLVLIAGPSASGKTTFSKRLSLQLRVNGVRPVALSTDNFYVNRDETPRDEHGRYDFESIEAIDLALFNEVLAGLLRGEEVLTPRFEFTTGQRRPRDKWRPMRLEAGQVLVVEGIHGLNPRLTEAVPEGQKFRIHINALTQLCLDDHYRTYTSDTRLLRRIVRDRLFRGYSAATTIETWPRVRRGELRNIYPFQEQADMMFNSSLVYEMAVLRLYAERFLLEVPQDHPSFANAHRLLRYVSHFVPMFDESIPDTSLLREFIGGSQFEY